MHGSVELQSDPKSGVSVSPDPGEDPQGRLLDPWQDQQDPKAKVDPGATALFHLDKPQAHAFLGSCSDSNKIDGWYLDIGATHHMTGMREHFSEFNTTVRGSIKFGDTSTVEITGAGEVTFVAKTGERG